MRLLNLTSLMENNDTAWNTHHKTIALSNTLNLAVGAETSEVPLLPSSFMTKLRLMFNGRFTMITRLQIRLIPLVSRKSGVSAKLYIRDISDVTGAKLHVTESLSLGREILCTLRHVAFSMVTKEECPIVFGFEGLRSPYLEGRNLFHISLKWVYASSNKPYTLPPVKFLTNYQDLDKAIT